MAAVAVLFESQTAVHSHRMSRPIPPPPALNPVVVLGGSINGYFLLLVFITPRNATRSRLALSHEAISAFHSTLVTLASAYELWRTRNVWSQSLSGIEFRVQDDAKLPIITTRSNFGNCITAVETGYLFQDLIVLLHAFRSPKFRGTKNSLLSKEINTRLLIWHHSILLILLLLLQRYINFNQERGILIILMLFLMNASTPIGALHWYLVNFRPSAKKAIFRTNLAYLIMYALCRVYLPVWILEMYGKQTGHGVLEVWKRLRMPCKLGMSGLAIVNALWLGMACKKFWRRYGG
jgi:hypothetical protein